MILTSGHSESAPQETIILIMPIPHLPHEPVFLSLSHAPMGALTNRRLRGGVLTLFHPTHAERVSAEDRLTLRTTSCEDNVDEKTA